MRVIKTIVLIVLILVVIAGVGLFIFLKTFDINKYRPQVESALGSAIHRHVSIGPMKLNIGGAGLSLDVRRIRIADDPEISQGDFLQAAAVKLSVDLAAFLSRREIVVTQVAVENPVMTLIRTKEGALNIPAVSAPSPAGASAAKPAAKAPAGDPPSGLPQLSVQSFEISHGEVIFEDRSVPQAGELKVKDIGVRVKGFSLAAPFPVRITAGVLSDTDNLSVSGQVTVTPPSSAQVTDLTATLDLDGISDRNLQTALRLAPGAAMVQKVRGTVSISVARLNIANGKVAALTTSGTWKGGEVALQPLPAPVTDIALAFDATMNTVHISSLSCRLAGGTARISGSVDNYLQSPVYALKANLAGIQLGQLLPPFGSSLRFDGSLNSDLSVSGSGIDPQAPLKNVKLAGNLTVADGRLKNVNLLRMVLDKISMLPNLVNTITAALPEKYQQLLNRNDTVFDKIAFTFAPSQPGHVRLQQGQLVTSGFTLDLQAGLDWHNVLSLDGTVTVAPDLSAAMTSQVKELAGLTDSEGQIKIPLQHYEGPVASVSVSPDLDYIGKRLIKQQLKEQMQAPVQKLLNKVLPGVTQTQNQTGSQGNTSGEQPAQQLINGVLNQIFK